MPAFFALFLWLSQPALADSLDCSLQRKGAPAPLLLSGPILEDSATTATSGVNELKLKLDASVSPNSFFFVLQDDARLWRASFIGSPRGSAAEPAFLGTGESRASCRKNLSVPSATFPAYPSLPEYFACALDEMKFIDGTPTGLKQLSSTVVSTMMFRLPQAIKGGAGTMGFQIKFNRTDFQHGLEIILKDFSSGADARYSGPAAALNSSFMIGLTQGDRATSASFHRLGCLFTNDPNAFR